jgi:HSP20 family protein
MKNTEMDSSQNASELSSKSSPEGILSFDELDDFFDDFLARRWPLKPGWNAPRFAKTNALRVDILEHENDIEVQAALPGVKKEDIEILINHQTITIRSSSKEEIKEEEKGKYCRREIMRGEFQRTLSIPDNIDGDKAEASFQNGILKVVIPKSKKNNRKIIEIQ